MQTFGGATPLMYACQQCRENQVLDILTKQPFVVKDRDRTLKTPLHYCAENPNTSCAEIVLKFAPELVNAQDENGYCTLHLSVIAGNKSLIKLLIAAGADVNIYDNEGHSAVHWAIVSSEKEALEMIIRAGANPSTPDIHGGYPLHYAVQMCGSTSDYIRNYEDTVRVVETLLNFGVDVNVKDKDGRQPILWAASAGSADAVIHLVSGGACVEAADKDGLTALHCAASRGHTTTLDTLITLCGTNVDVIDGNGCSALFYSVTLGHADATEVLLELGAESNRQDRKGRTPAHCGAAKGQLETLRILQKHGGNLWLRNVKGDIPLHEAIASGRKDLVLWLLSQNPEAVNIANNDGRCPLHIAAMYNNTEMVKILLDAKSLVNPVMRTSKGVLMTPLNVALCKGHRSCGKYLQLHGGVPFSKVAKIEQASAFAFRVSPTTEIVNNSVENNVDSLPLTKAKVSASNTSTDVQTIKIETADKKKIYRRRKKRKTLRTDFQESDSDENSYSVKTKTYENRKNGQDENDENEVDNETDENDENIEAKKVQISMGKNYKKAKEKAEKTSKTNAVSNKSANDVAAKETVAIKRTTKSKAEAKPLPKNKSLKESKNVNNLSPDDFPPLMQAVNQLDSVIIEPEIDMNKTGNEYDAEGGLRAPNSPVGELSGNEQTTDAVEKKKETVNIKTKGNDEISEGKKMEENKVLLENEKNQKETPLQKDEKSAKAVKKQRDDVKKDERTLQSIKSKNGDGTKQKNEKMVKSASSKSSSDEVKKYDNISQTEIPKVSSSDKIEKSTSLKKAKNTISDPISQNSDKKVEKMNMQILEKELQDIELKEETVLINEEAKAEDEGAFENEKPEKEGIVSSEGKEREEKQGTVQEVVTQEKKLENRVEKTLDAAGEKVPNLELKSFDEKLAIATDETPIMESSNVTEASELIPVQLTEAVISPKPQIFDEKNLEEEKSVREKDEFSGAHLTEEPKHEPKAVNEETQLTNSTKASELEKKILDKGKTNVTVSEPLQNDLNLDVSAASGHENLSVEKQKFSKVLPKKELVKADLLEITKIHLGSEKISTEAPIKVSENSKPEDTADRVNNNEANIPDEYANSNGNSENKTTIDNEQGQYKPAKVPRLCRRHKDLKCDMSQASVTQLVQSTIKKYHMERGIFYQLLELKRYQIRSGKANEQVLVKRLADEYERSRIFLGMKPYSGIYRFKDFEKFLYDQLQALNNRRSFIVPEIKSYDDIDALSGFLKKSRYKIFSEIPQPEMVCTCITQRCHHSACAYTSIPCSAYIADLRHHKHHKKRKECFFPRIDQRYKSDNQKYIEQPATLELIQGNEKHVITLPQNYPHKSKRYYVTFTIKGVTSPKEEDAMDDSKNYFKHRHAKSV